MTILFIVAKGDSERDTQKVEPERDTQKVKPESIKAFDLDPETLSTMEKMMELDPETKSTMEKMIVGHIYLFWIGCRSPIVALGNSLCCFSYLCSLQGCGIEPVSVVCKKIAPDLIKEAVELGLENYGHNPTMVIFPLLAMFRCLWC